MRLQVLYKIFIILSIVLFVGVPVFAALPSIAFLSAEALAQEEAAEGEIDELKNQIDNKEKEVQELQQKAEEYKGVIGQKQEEAETLSDLIVSFNRQIKGLENDIAIKQKEISSVSLKIRRTELEIRTRKEEIKRTQNYITALLREVYENDDREIVELVLKHKNFSEFFNQVEYRSLLQEDLKLRLGEIKRLKEKLEADKNQLDTKRKDLKALKEELENRNQILEAQKTQKKNLLEKTRSAEWRYKNLLNDALQKQEEIRREIFELEDQLRRTLDPGVIPSPMPGVLRWPSEGIFTQGYGCLGTAFARRAYPACNNGRGGFHNAVDVASGFGTPVVAARDGAVVAVENSPYAYGKWAAIEHDNGLVTVYTHLSLQLVVPGEVVDRGDIVGYMGSSGFSTGSHIHFMVYAPGTFTTQPSKIAGILPIGATLNPLDYLP